MEKGEGIKMQQEFPGVPQSFFFHLSTLEIIDFLSEESLRSC